MAGTYEGDRVDRGNPRYPTMVQGFNPRWIASPEFVQVCGDTDQVVQTVQNAYDAGKRITVRCGGHCYEDFVCDNVDGVLIDLSPMNGISRASPQGPVCVEGGATLWNVYNELYRQFGLTLPGGSCYSVGVGGHVTGGGYGLLSRLYGLTVDYLSAVEVVRVDSSGKAEAIVAERDSSDEESREILWGHLGGGGGNFGVVTKFWFDELPPAPEQVCLLNLAWDWGELTQESFTELIEDYGEALAAHSEPEDPLSGLFTLLHLNQCSGSQSQISLTAQLVEPEPGQLDGFISRVTRALPSPTALRGTPVGHGQPAGITIEERTLPWLFATQALNGEVPNQRGKYKSAYMLEPFPADQIATIWKYLGHETNPAAAHALLQVDSYGCQVNAVAPDATAVPQRSSILKLQYQTYWLEESKDAENLAWMSQFYGEMYPGGEPLPGEVMDGCFINYPDVELENWQTLYYKDNYPRLQQVKALCDPNDVFHHQQSIELPG